MGYTIVNIIWLIQVHARQNLLAAHRAVLLTTTQSKQEALLRLLKGHKLGMHLGNILKVE